MNAFITRFGAWIAWVLPFALIALLLGWETDWGRTLADRPVPQSTPAPPPVSVALLPDYAVAGGVDARRETVVRTLFNPTRRPAPVLAQDGAKPRMQRGQFVLTGTAVVGTKAIAFMREVNGGKPRSAKMGDVINGLTVADVKPDRVKLVLGEESEEVVLRVATGPRTTTQPVPAQPPPAAGMPAESGQPVAAQPQPAGGGDASQSLLERRRAARAAAAQGQQPPAGGIPAVQNPAVPQQPAPAPATAAAPAAAPAAPADPGWASVYQRMQQRP
jgi:hypothetical protein